MALSFLDFSSFLLSLSRDGSWGARLTQVISHIHLFENERYRVDLRRPYQINDYGIFVSR